MRTGRSLTVCCSLLPGGVSALGGVCSPEGVCSGGCSQGGVCSRGSAPGGCLLWGVCLGGGGVCSGGCPLWGVSVPRRSALGGGGVSQHALRQTPSPLPVDIILDTRLWKYYLGPTLLWLVITVRKQCLGQGNVFTRVCHSVHSGRVCPGGCGSLPGGVSVRQTPLRMVKSRQYTSYWNAFLYFNYERLYKWYQYIAE